VILASLSGDSCCLFFAASSLNLLCSAGGLTADDDDSSSLVTGAAAPEGIDGDKDAVVVGEGDGIVVVVSGISSMLPATICLDLSTVLSGFVGRQQQDVVTALVSK
jgi:hypothetical protein